MHPIRKEDHIPIEIFGFVPEDKSAQALHYRKTRICPFTESLCTKKLYRTNEPPTGSCAVSHLGRASIICPNRFLEDRRQVLTHAAEVALGRDGPKAILSEVGLPKGFGRVDWLAVKVNQTGDILDYAPIEIQANQTTSTGALTNAIKEYERTGKFSKTYYRYGLNSYMQIKTFFTQCLNKGQLFAKWNKKYLWVMQDMIYENWTQRFQLELHGGPDTGDSIFIVYEFVYDDALGRYRLKMRGISSAARAELLEAYSRPTTKLPEESSFLEAIKEKLTAHRMVEGNRGLLKFL